MTAAQTLNEAQIRAVHAPLGPTLVPAGPGSGKTRVVSDRVAWMIADMNIPPRAILVFTFTNRAARELRQRLQLRLAPDDYQDLFAGTFHSWGAAFLRRHCRYTDLDENFSIYDRQDSLELIAEAMALADDPDLDNRRGPRWRLETVTRWKSRGQTPDELLAPWASRLEMPPHQRPKHVHRIVTYREYQQLLRHNNAADFEDLITLPLQIMESNPDLLAELQQSVRHVIVDEYQDTSRNQHRLVTTIANRPDESRPSLFIVGDSDQAIYAFRYADIRNLNQFRQEDYPNAREIQLQDNYRSTPEIIGAAQTLIEYNRDRIPRQSTPTRASGLPLRWIQAQSPEDEASRIADEIADLLADDRFRPEDICIAYRTNPQSRPVEQALHSRGILYQVTGNFEFFERAEIRRHMDYLKLAVNPRDTHTLKRIINIPARRIGPKAMLAVLSYADAQDCHLRTAIAELPDRKVADISKAGREGLRQLDRALTTLRQMAEEKQPVGDLIRHIGDGCGLVNHFSRMTDGARREANIGELRLLADQTQDPDAQRFLEQSSVGREKTQPDAGRVALSTIHQTKGMEWPCVYVIGVEEGLMPHDRSSEERQDVEEERRLLYVAMTRAESRLTLSWCRKRGNDTTERSRFIDELPAGCWERRLPR